MSMFLFLIGMVGFFVCLVLLIIAFVKKKEKKKILIGMAACFVAFVVGVSMSSPPNQNGEESTDAVTSVQSEKQQEKIEKQEKQKMTKDEEEEDNKTAVNEKNQDESEEPKKSDSEQELEDIVLSYNELGVYGQSITLNSGTVDEYSYIGFFLSPGTYEVYNANLQQACQITVYQNETAVNEDGIEEPVSPENGTKPIVLMQEETGEITLEENQYVKLSDGSMFIHFRKK